MGVTSSNQEVVFVDDDPKEIRQSVGFSPTIFQGREFATLKTFCNKRDIHQRQLNAVWKRYLSTDEIYIREFRVRTLDTKDAFKDMSKIYQEISEIFIPTIFMKEFNGLQEGHSLEQVTFPRFIIMSYIFCAQPIPDLIYDFVCILRQRFNLQLSAIMFAFNFEQIVHVMSEELKPTAAKMYLLQLCQNFKKEEELSVGKIIAMGVKYPLLFYQLKRFRAHFRRLVFGDKFWVARKQFKTKLGGELAFRKGYDVDFATETSAARATARSLLRDVIFHAQQNFEMRLTDRSEAPLTEIDDDACTLLKKTLGYQLARSLILDSELPYPSSGQAFLDPSFVSTGGPDERLNDHVSRQDFVYNVSSGKAAWLLKYLSPTGESIKETEHSRVSHIAFEQATTEGGESTEQGDVE